MMLRSLDVNQTLQAVQFVPHDAEGSIWESDLIGCVLVPHDAESYGCEVDLKVYWFHTTLVMERVTLA